VAARRGVFVGVGLLLTFALVGAGSLFCINLMALQTVRSDTTYPFSGSAVEVDVALGDVQIERGRAGEVAVSRNMVSGLRRPKSDAEARGNTFVITDRACPLQRLFRCDLSWTISVPPEVDVVVAAGRSDINVVGVDGSVKVASTGKIDVAHVTGEVALVTHDGDIRAKQLRSERFVAISDEGRIHVSLDTAPRLVIARTKRGEVEIEVPDGTGPYRVKAVTDDGLSTVTVPTDTNSDRTVSIESGAGNVFVTQHSR